MLEACDSLLFLDQEWNFWRVSFFQQRRAAQAETKTFFQGYAFE